jgi:transcriptional regulator with GAF, ATPase, and Fis domain
MLEGASAQLENPKELLQSKEAETHIVGLRDQIQTIKEMVRGLTPAIEQSRFAALSTRLAVHFFTERSMHRFCERVLDELIQETGARTGAFVLFGETASKVEIVAARNSGKESLPFEEHRISRTILSRIREGEASVLIDDAVSEQDLGIEDSVRKLPLRSVLAIPLRVEDYLAGAIYLENAEVVGAFDELSRQLLLEVGRLVTVYLDSAFRLNAEIKARQRIYSEVKGKTHFDGIVGSSRKLMKILDLVEQVGPSEATAIIEGESGTGKELVARAIHQTSKRAKRPLVVVNCAAIPDTLLESQLFGHERGAFTGAVHRQIGRLEQADKGTVFLDEVGELSLPTQAKLLRFLQNREIERLGGRSTIRLDVRLLAATNRDIQAMVKRGDFRDDLYYRLYVIPVKVPPLRERLEDVPLLWDHFMEIFSLQSRSQRPEVAPEVYDLLQLYAWPGNIRELENLVERLVVMCKSGRIGIGDLPSHIVQGRKITLDIDKNPFGAYLASLPTNWPELKRRRKQMLTIASVYSKKLEDMFIDDLLEKTGGNISRAAQQSGMHRTMIHRRLKARNQ